MIIRGQRFSSNQVSQVLGGVLGHDLHAKRVASLCDATLGVLHGTSLAVSAIGQALAAACSPTQRSRSTISSFAGFPSSLARAVPSWWR
jgi:hypothetical protein